MNWETAVAISEITGAIAVVVTLIYLSRQIRENSRQLRLTSSTDLGALMNQAFDPIYNNEKNSAIWITGLADPGSLKKDQQQIFVHLFTRLMAVYDTVVEHHDLGALGDVRFTNWANMTRVFVESPGGQWWLAQSDFHYEFSPTARNSLGLGD